MQVIERHSEDTEESEYEELDEDDEDDDEAGEKLRESPQPQHQLEANFQQFYEGQPSTSSAAEHELQDPMEMPSTSSSDERVEFYNEGVRGGQRTVVVEDHRGSTQIVHVDEDEMAVAGPICVVCGRTESAKIRLFKWPKSVVLRSQWTNFFKLKPAAEEAVASGAYICCFHFTSDTFIMVDSRVFWKAAAMPKYRLRRPCITDPFPWEQAANPYKMVGEHSTGYKIRYRMPYNKHRNRTSHEVAVLSPISQPHIFYEFSFNRATVHNTKYYACLACRRAKTESGVRDVIRTIHLDGFKFLSRGDPFTGHHFACRPYNIYDYKHRVEPPPFEGETEVLYTDEQGNPVEWEDCGADRPSEMAILEFRPTPAQEQRNGVMSIEPHELLLDGAVVVDDDLQNNHHHQHDQHQHHEIDGKDDDEMYAHLRPLEDPRDVAAKMRPVDEELPQAILAPQMEQEFYEGAYKQEAPPVLLGPMTSAASTISSMSSAKSAGRRMRCHLCPRRGFASTDAFIEHLQAHVATESSCRGCGVRVTVDERPRLKRAKLCVKCFAAYSVHF